MGNTVTCSSCLARRHSACLFPDFCACSYCAEMKRHRSEREPVPKKKSPVEPQPEPKVVPTFDQSPGLVITSVYTGGSVSHGHSGATRFPTNNHTHIKLPPPKPKRAKRPWCSECLNRLYHEEGCPRAGLPMNQIGQGEQYICVCEDSVIDGVGECQTCHRPWLKGHSPNRNA